VQQIQDALTPENIILIAFFLLVGFPVHEFAHAFVAYRLGDGTAKLFGRLSLNPAVHFDPLGGLMLVVSVLTTGFAFGWAKPTPVNPSNLRDRRNGELLVSLAGPASNLIMATIMAVIVRVLVATGVITDFPTLVLQVLYYFVFFNIALAIFNLIPIPPLDGSAILFRFLDPRSAWQARALLTQYGFIILIVIILFGGRILGPIVNGITDFLLGF
jgi:Zn-dependent protease